MFSCALPLQKHSYLFVGKVKGRSATDGELSPISGSHCSVFFLFIHLNEPTAFFFTRVFVLLAFCRAHCYLRGVCEQSKLQMVCGEKGGKRSQMESDIYPETAVDPVIYISAYTAITMCLSFCSGGSQ